MQRQKKIVYLWLWILSLMVIGAGWENVPVREIKILGNRKIEKQAILYKLQTKIDEPFSSLKIEKDIAAIYDLGYFEDIKVDIKEIKEGLLVTYILSERPLIKKISFTGNKKIKTESLQEKIDISTGTTFNPSLVKKNIQNLTQFYKDEGYYLAKITFRVETIAEDWVELIFDIEEGQKIKINKVIIEGNKSYKDKEIAKLLKTKKHGFFSFISSSGYVKKDVLSQDIQQIEDFYFNNGFINALIEEPVVSFNHKEKTITITINIKEGNQFRINCIHIQGNEVLSIKELQKRMTIKEGDIFNRAKLRESITTIQDTYAERGYVFTRVVPVTNEIPEENKIDVTLEIEEGGLTYVKHINIGGHIKTRDKVIRREMTIKEGEIFNSQKIRQSYNNINNLGFFEEINVDVQPDPENSKLDLDIKVKERMTGQMSVGGGFSSQDRWVGTAEIKQGNLFGRGQKLFISAEIAESRSTYDIGFTEPWLFDIPLSAGADIYYTDKVFTFTKTARGGDIRLGYPVAEFTQFFNTYLYENVHIKIDDPNSVSDDIRSAEGRSTTSSLRWSLVRDSRDNRIKPTTGSTNKLSFQFAGGILGGTNDFTKTILESGWHFPIWKKLILSLHGKIGYGKGYRGKELPVFERFYAGGLDTVRGYEERGIGPKDDENNAVGGNKLVVTNLELNFPIYDIVHGVLFWDSGNVFEDKEKFFYRSLRMGVGLGVRFFTPVGPLRLDLGYPLNREPGENPSVWHFAIGTYF